MAGTPISGSPIFWDTFDIPADGQLRTSGSASAALGPLADRTIWLRDRVAESVGIQSYSYDSNTTLVQNLVDDGAFQEAEGDGILVDLATEEDDIVFASFSANVAGTWLDEARIQLYFKAAYGTGSETKANFSPAFHMSANSGSKFIVSIHGGPQLIPNGLGGTFRVGVQTSIPTGSAGLTLVNGIKLWVVRFRGVPFIPV